MSSVHFVDSKQYVSLLVKHKNVFIVGTGPPSQHALVLTSKLREAQRSIFVCTL